MNWGCGGGRVRGGREGKEEGAGGREALHTAAPTKPILILLVGFCFNVHSGRFGGFEV